MLLDHKSQEPTRLPTKERQKSKNNAPNIDAEEVARPPTDIMLGRPCHNAVQRVTSRKGSSGVDPLADKSTCHCMPSVLGYDGCQHR
jgi:hypothetical protein